MSSGRLHTVRHVSCVLLLAGSLATTASVSARDSVTFGVADRLPWHGEGVWLHGDTHVHRLLILTQGVGFATAARAWGLDFLATTEHTQRAIHPRSKATLDTMRQRFPDLILLAGVEWNVPGAGHASLIVEQAEGEWALLESFAEKFDRKIYAPRSEDTDEDGGATWGSLERAKQGLRWLERRAREGGPRSAVYLNHVSRHALIDARQIAELRRAGLHGIEAAAGHQKRDPPGTPNSIDRHEPYVAIVGGGFDGLLAAGRHIGLSAGSDIHIEESSYLPGEFSRSLVYAPERTPAGVVQGLAAGSTATIVGRIVRSVETRATYEGLDDFALIAESLHVPRGKRVTYTVEIEVSKVDAGRRKNRIDRVEIISDWKGQPQIVQVFENLEPGRVSLDYSLPARATGKPGRFFLRARGRRQVGAEGNDLANADLMFYTGGTRVRVLDRR